MKTPKKTLCTILAVVMMLPLLTGFCRAPQGVLPLVANEPPAPDDAITVTDAETKSDTTADAEAENGSDTQAEYRNPADYPNIASYLRASPSWPATFKAHDSVLRAPVFYDLVFEKVEYDKRTSSYIYCFKLSDAGKIDALLRYGYTGYSIQEELDRLKKYNQAEYCLDQIIYSGQEQTLRQMLSEATLAQITDEMDAYTLLQLIQKQPEYTANAKLQKFVDNYLWLTLGMTELRHTMGTLYCEVPGSAEFAVMDLYQSMSVAEWILQTEEYQNFWAAMQPFVGRNRDAWVLRMTYTDEELAEYYEALTAATVKWWGRYSAMLDAYRFYCKMPEPLPSDELA